MTSGWRFIRHTQQDNCHNRIIEHGVTSRNKLSGTDKGSNDGDHHYYHFHLNDVVRESFTYDSWILSCIFPVRKEGKYDSMEEQVEHFQKMVRKLEVPNMFFMLRSELRWSWRDRLNSYAKGLKHHTKQEESLHNDLISKGVMSYCFCFCFVLKYAKISLLVDTIQILGFPGNDNWHLEHYSLWASVFMYVMWLRCISPQGTYSPERIRL